MTYLKKNNADTLPGDLRIWSTPELDSCSHSRAVLDYDELIIRMPITLILG